MYEGVDAKQDHTQTCHLVGFMLQSVTFRFRNFSVSKLLGLETFPFFMVSVSVSKKVSVSVSKFFGIEKSIGIGFEIFWYR